MARLDRLRVYPVKGLDGIDLEAASILDGGTHEYDREYALFDAEDAIINGKRTPRIHELDTEFDPESGELGVIAPDGEMRTYVLGETEDREDAESWFGDYFEEDVALKRDQSVGYVDRREMGPSVISTETLREVASWFDGLTVEDARRRMRANVEIAGEDVEPFWEDRFVGEGAPAFEVGSDEDGVRFEGVTPCGRCIVPQRDPDTGEPIEEFQQRFVENREETFPAWADEDAFDHYYTLMLIARIPGADRGQQLHVGDSVTVLEN